MVFLLLIVTVLDLLLVYLLFVLYYYCDCIRAFYAVCVCNKYVLDELFSRFALSFLLLTLHPASRNGLAVGLNTR